MTAKEKKINLEILPNIMPDLTVFEENLTAKGLQEIREEAQTFPVKVTNKADYNFIYTQHQRFKRLHLAVRKRAVELKKEEKSTYKEKTKKIDLDLDLVLKVITPIVGHLDGARDFWDSEIAAHKENNARKAAALQKAEFERREKIRLEQEATAKAELKYSADWDLAHAENEIFDEKKRYAIEAVKIKQAQENLEKERLRMERDQADMERKRQEFEIEKNRLSFDEACEEAESLIKAKKQFRKSIKDNWGTSRERQSAASAIPEIFKQFGINDRLSFDEAWKEAHEINTRIKIVTGVLACDKEPAIKIENAKIIGGGALSPEIMTDTEIMKQIRLSSEILKNEISKHIDSGFQSQANSTKVYNFFLTLRNFISDISNDT